MSSENEYSDLDAQVVAFEIFFKKIEKLCEKDCGRDEMEELESCLVFGGDVKSRLVKFNSVESDYEDDYEKVIESLNEKLAFLHFHKKASNAIKLRMHVEQSWVKVTDFESEFSKVYDERTYHKSILQLNTLVEILYRSIKAHRKSLDSIRLIHSCMSKCYDDKWETVRNCCVETIVYELYIIVTSIMCKFKTYVKKCEVTPEILTMVRSLRGIDSVGAESNLKDCVEEHVQLNFADSELDFDISENGLQGQALYEGSFAHCWSGARANVGIIGGNFMFGCRIIAAQTVDLEDTTDGSQHLCRVGVSRGDVPLGKLGEVEYSFAYEGTGKFLKEGEFRECGQKFKFGIGDVIVCEVNLEKKIICYCGVL